MKSDDGGANWRTMTNSFLANDYYSIAVSPGDPLVFFAGYRGGVFKGDSNTGIFGSVFAFTGTATSLAIDRFNPNTIYAGGAYATSFLDQNVFKSTNNGTSWVRTGDPNLGIVNVPIYSLAISPANSSVIYGGTGANTSLGYFNAVRSTNGGVSYDPGQFNIGVFDTTAIAVDPTNPNIIYGGTSTFAGTPGGTITTGGGIVKTTNGGLSFTSINSGLTNLRVLALVIDPTNSNTVYAGTYGGGVFKSTNGGLSWTAFNSGLTTTSQLRINGMQIDSSGKRIYASTDAGVFMITLSP